ncbi:hypothetical protein [Thetidibacter halocola]|uniref:Uncharacterized protein n=1 Tax=Thetidibacter halocola TaxID=2827239 RepID=A0A8J7WG08_9RHOB|nr:hypothetical protein [Thetidibacter halocola]MBS0125699.1 hypothetical protein [Thetidibacter halocola]
MGASGYTLTKTRFRNGMWEGLLAAGADDPREPEIAVTYHGTPVRGVTVSGAGAPGRWVLEVPVPVEAVGDGVQTFLILDMRTDTVLDSFALLGGDALSEDMQAEMALLRAELDMLKRAFRRHCLEGR